MHSISTRPFFLDGRRKATKPSLVANAIAKVHSSRVAFMGNAPPRRCGIATFTSDLQQAVRAAASGSDACIVAMTDNGQIYDYTSDVQLQIPDDDIQAYKDGADFLNSGAFDVVCLQHEFGIFGGSAGSHILALLSRLTIPVVTTLHTVLARPTQPQRDVLGQIVALSSRIVVMGEKGRELLQTVYLVPSEKIEVVPHGVPDFPFLDPGPIKTELGFAGRRVILTFGLLSPNKGIEVMINAMPSILERCGDAVYVILGATHPNLVRTHGEAYRHELMARVQELGIKDHVVFVDQFVDQDTLLRYISLCDVYVTPYLGEEQMTSGSLSYSFGLGKAVVSTPYWHACELLADGRGMLVPFGDVGATGQAVVELLTNENHRQTLRERAYANSRSMIWERTAERYLGIFDQAVRDYAPRVVKLSGPVLSMGTDRVAAPEMRTSYLRSMCDDTGIFQHALHAVPDRSHGYCVDDNARALLVACMLEQPGEQALPEPLVSTFAAFVQHAWNRDTKRFRNFMSFDRRWLEDCGSEDSHGRTLWALGEAARDSGNLPRQPWAAELFAEALSPVEDFTSPRAWAFTLLGLEAYRAGAGKYSAEASRMQALLADRLMSILATVETADWAWFEEELSYDNARLSQALIVTGLSTGVTAYRNGGVLSLRWLMTVQTAASGLFRPVGTTSFGNGKGFPTPFDQQPLEATAAIAACLAAYRADGDEEWLRQADRAFGWFMGSNDLLVSLVDLETGSCRDGLHPDRANENRGGESVVSYLLALGDMRHMARGLAMSYDASTGIEAQAS